MAFPQLNRLHLENFHLAKPSERCRSSIYSPLNKVRGESLPYQYNSLVTRIAIVLFFMSLSCYTNALGIAAALPFRLPTTSSNLYMRCMSYRCIKSNAPCPGVSDLANFAICPIRQDSSLVYFTKIWPPIQIFLFQDHYMTVHVSPYLFSLCSSMTTRPLKILENDLSLTSTKHHWYWDNMNFRANVKFHVPNKSILLYEKNACRKLSSQSALTATVKC